MTAARDRAPAAGLCAPCALRTFGSSFGVRQASVRLSLRPGLLRRLQELRARGPVRRIGVHPPETCVDPDDLFTELQRRGCASR